MGIEIPLREWLPAVLSLLMLGLSAIPGALLKGYPKLTKQELLELRPELSGPLTLNGRVAGCALVVFLSLLIAAAVGQVPADRAVPWMALAVLGMIAWGLRFSAAHGVWYAPTLTRIRFVVGGVPSLTRVAYALAEVGAAIAGIAMLWVVFA